MPTPDPVSQESGRGTSKRSSFSFGLNCTVDREGVDGLVAEFRHLVRDAVKEELAAHPVELPVETEKSPSATLPDARARGIELPATEPLKARDLRMSLLLGKLPEDSGLLIDSDTLAKLLGIARRTLDRMVSSRAIPPPIVISGRIRRWRLAEVLEWIEEGCPHPRHWTYTSDTAARNRGKGRR